MRRTQPRRPSLLLGLRSSAGKRSGQWCQGGPALLSSSLPPPLRLNRWLLLRAIAFLRRARFARSRTATGGPMGRAEIAIRKVTQDWTLACNTKQIDDLMDLYSPDALLL